MLTKDEFVSLFRAGKTDEINEAYASATPDEQQQYMAWLDEAKPADIPEPEQGDPFETILPEDEPEPNPVAQAIEDAVARLLADSEPKNSAANVARKRANRSNMLRSIRARFRLMEPFSITECADRIGRDPQEVGAYLVHEIRIGNPAFSYNSETKKFFLDNPFT